MIFVTVGTNEAPFDRLLTAIARLGGDEEIMVQCGASKVRPANARCVDFMPFDELVAQVDRARVVVTHAGVGSVLVALGRGRHPVVVPRLRRFGEAVDDHQLGFARRFETAGLVTLVEDESRLGAALVTAATTVPPQTGAARLAEDLRGYIQETLGSR
jgi:UDP-N-acetylglucosamine transferase subunit ALG13